MINQLLNELDQLQKKEFKEEWKEVGRQLIIQDLRQQLLNEMQRNKIISISDLKSFFDNFKGK